MQILALAGPAVAVAKEPLASGGALLPNLGMFFADLKNDFVFRRIFAKHPDILRGLLNDLLERQGDRAIEGIEYLLSSSSRWRLGRSSRSWMSSAATAQGRLSWWRCSSST